MSSQGAADLVPKRASTHELVCEIATSLEALEKISGQWDRLATGDTIFQRFGWFRAFVRAYGSRLKVFTPVISDGDTVIGILPLIICGKTVKFAAGDYNDIIAIETASAEVLRQGFLALIHAQRHWDECVFENIPADSRIARHLSELPADIRRRVQVSFRYPCPTVVVDDPIAGELRKLALKKDIRRQQHRLERIGPLVFRHLDSRDAILARLPEFFEQHIQRRAVLGQKSRFLEPEARAFYENLALEFDPRGPLRFSVLEVDKMPVAFHFGFEYNSTFLRFTSVFNVDFLAYSPGEVLLGRLLTYADDRGVREFDFGIGGEDYKRRFSNHVKQNLAVYLDRRGGAPQYVKRRAVEVARRAKEKVKQQAYASRHGRGIMQQLLRSAAEIKAVGVVRWFEGLLVAARQHLLCRDDVDVLVAAPASHVACASSCELSPASLGQLGFLALEHPELRLHLREFADRLKNGDLVYINQVDGGPVSLAWVGSRSVVDVPAHDPIGHVRLDKTADVLYDYWASKFDFRQQKQVIDWLAHQASAAGRELWVLARHDLNLRQSVPELQFELKHRFTRTRMLGLTHTATDAHRRATA